MVVVAILINTTSSLPLCSTMRHKEPKEEKTKQEDTGDHQEPDNIQRQIVLRGHPRLLASHWF